jgi:hypothetical protein
VERARLGPGPATLDVGAMIYWSLLKRCTPRVELMAAASNNAHEVYAMIFNGSTWGNKVMLSTDDGDRDHRPFYIAYERSSGDGLVVYRKGNNPTVYYRRGTARRGPPSRRRRSPPPVTLCSRSSCPSRHPTRS